MSCFYVYCIAVIAGNEGVPDTLQKCHSMSRDLQNNQTVIFSHLSDLRFQISNITIQVYILYYLNTYYAY